MRKKTRFIRTQMAWLTLALPAICLASAPDWPPLYEGQTKASFRASARLMASAGQQDVSLHFGPLGLRSLTTEDLRGRFSPLFDVLDASNVIPVRDVTWRGEHGRMLKAVLYIVSVSPDIVMAVPDDLSDSDPYPMSFNYLSQESLDKVRKWHHLANTESAENCHMEGLYSICDLRKGLPQRLNSVLITRLVLDRPGAWIASSEGVQAVPPDGKFTVAGKKFQLIAVPNASDVKELAPSD